MYKIYDMDWNEEDVLEDFSTQSEAISYILEILPSDDFAYIVADDSDDALCIVFQGRVWRPQ